MSTWAHTELLSLSAASGWLDLGNPGEALAELDRLPPEKRGQPETLSLEWEIRRERKEWQMAVELGRRLAETAPNEAEGLVKEAYALHEMKRTREAWDRLLPASQRFKKETIIPYNLACYACQMGQPEEALKWLRRAFVLDRKKDFRRMALEDPDLQPLREEIKKLTREKN